MGSSSSSISEAKTDKVAEAATEAPKYSKVAEAATEAPKYSKVAEQATEAPKYSKVAEAETEAPVPPPPPPEVTVDETSEAQAAVDPVAEAQELIRLAQALQPSVEVASPSSPTASPARCANGLGELDCVQCESLLFEPTTLEDGLTVCRPCVKKRRLANGTADMNWSCTPTTLGFGNSANVILSDLLGRCPEAQAQAAEQRQQGNRFFGEGKYAEACEAYSQAISKSPDIVVLCNRSLVQLKLGDIESAVADARLALAKAARCSGPEMLAKAWLRLGQALCSSSDALLEAAYALARGGAYDGLPDLCAKMSRNDLQKVKEWLQDGCCPPVEDTLPDAHMEKADTKFDEDWLRNQLECPLCLGLLWEPSSIPCGHTLCRSCLARTLDHAFDTSPSCPMCRAELSGYLAWLNDRALRKGVLGAKFTHGGAQIPVNRQISAIIEKYFPAESRERQAQIALAEAEAAVAPPTAAGAPVVPIFICSLAMPGVACPLHIFEPRYRLMMRRCIDSGQRQFGMCLFPGDQSGDDSHRFGTMLHIQSFKQLADGRSQIKTIGTRRFEVLEWGQKDGYATGSVRWVEDTPLTPEDGGEASTKAVRLRKVVESLLKKLAPEDRVALEEQLGPMPCADGSDGPHCPAFVFWCMGLVSLPPRIGYELCFGDSFREDAEKRLTTMLEIYEKKMRPSSGDANGEEEHSEDAEQSCEE